MADDIDDDSRHRAAPAGAINAVIAAHLKSWFRKLRHGPRVDPDAFLHQVSGVVHVGANTGQERDLYQTLGLRVCWIEPIPDVFARLQQHISGTANQRAFQALITDVDGRDYPFHVANNDGRSSSILDLKQHRDIWPEVAFSSTVNLSSITLASLFASERIDGSQYQALVMDTQGSELLVLKGAIALLKHFKYIKTEVPDFESYAGCCQLADISAFMTEYGYYELARNKFAGRAEGGSYFDIVYKRSEPPT